MVVAVLVYLCMIVLHQHILFLLVLAVAVAVDLRMMQVIMEQMREIGNQYLVM